jgi:hypothetical protein
MSPRIKENNKARFVRDVTLLSVSVVASVAFLFNIQRMARFSYDLMLAAGISTAAFVGTAATVNTKRYREAKRVQDYLIANKPSYRRRDLVGMEHCLLDVPDIWGLTEDQIDVMFESDRGDDVKYILPPNTY